MSDLSISDVLTSTLRALLRPVVRLMLARGVTLPLAVELLKRVYVQVALEDNGGGSGVTDSRVSLLTGVHRKDVRRLRGLPSAQADLPRKVSLGAQLLDQWTSRPPWCDAQGRARPLPRLASVGGALSFDALVASVSTDIRARPVLDEWLRLGMARVTARDEVELNEAAFTPQVDFDEQLSRLALQVGDHAMAAVDNLLGRADTWFECSVSGRAESPAAVVALRRRAAEVGGRALQTLGGDVKPEAAPVKEQGGRRYTFGVYFYADDDKGR